MARILFLLLIVISLLFTGCSVKMPPTQAESAENNETNARAALLADIDFTIIPDFVYYVLLEEKMTGSTVFVRRYVCYDGFADTASEKLQRIRLPEKVSDAAEARSYLQENEPEKLELLQPVYVSENVLARWTEEEHSLGAEENGRLSLEELLEMGGISRINKMFAISVNTEELVGLIKEAEEKHLQDSPRLQVTGELKPLPLSFTYSGLLLVHDEVQQESSPPLARAGFSLFYQIDELGNPLELEFETSFQQLQSGTRCLADIKIMEEFIAELREIVIEQLGLYGVNSHNESLTYANVTLCYEERSTETEISKKIYIR